MMIEKFAAIGFLSFSAFFGSMWAWGKSDIMAQKTSVKVECKVFGLLEENRKNQGIARGVLEVNEDLGGIGERLDVTDRWNELRKQYPENEPYVPVGIRSELFGNPEGLQLQISAWKNARAEGMRALYFFQL